MATAEPNANNRKRVVLFGMDCCFTASFMSTFLATPVADVAAIVLARTESAAQAAGSSSASHFNALGISAIELSRRSEMTSQEFLSTLAALDVDLIVVACFPWRLPSAVRALPSIASVNVHPSYLPEGRGPAPIFWAFRRGLAATGVTLHVMDEGFDTGPIIDQRATAIPTDATMISLEQSLARIGADMLGDFLRVPSHSVTTWPQPTDTGRPAPFPGADDLTVTTSWQATTAARFINGVSPVYGSIEVLVLANGQRLAVTEVLDIEESASAASAVRLLKDHAWIRFSDAVLRCRVRSAHQRLDFAI